MADYDVLADDSPLVIGATGLEAVRQCIRLIVATLVGTVPMDRGFADPGDFIDAPMPNAVAQRIAELTSIIEANEPRVRVTAIDMANVGNDPRDGRLRPTVRFKLREGVAL